MNILTNTILEIKTGERKYSFHCDGGSPLGEIHDALHQLKNYIGQRILEQLQQEQKEKTKMETPCPSPTP